MWLVDVVVVVGSCELLRVGLNDLEYFICPADKHVRSHVIMLIFHFDTPKSFNILYSQPQHNDLGIFSIYFFFSRLLR